MIEDTGSVQASTASTDGIYNSREKRYYYWGDTTGIEFDFQAGAGVNVQVGGGTEIAEGVLCEESRVVSWEEGFSLGGGIQGFRPEFDGVPDIDTCEYQ